MIVANGGDMDDQPVVKNQKQKDETKPLVKISNGKKHYKYPHTTLWVSEPDGPKKEPKDD